VYKRQAYNVAVNCGARGLATDANGNVWVGCRLPGGRGLYKLKYDPIGKTHLGEGGNRYNVPVYGLAIDGDGYIWISGYDDNKVYLFDTNEAHEVGTGVSAAGVYGIGVDSKGVAWAAGWPGSKVYKIERADVKSGSGIDTIPTPGCQARGIAVGAEDTIWVTCDSENKVIALDNSGVKIGEKIMRPVDDGANCSPPSAYKVVGITVTNDGTAWAVSYDAGCANKSDITRFKKVSGCTGSDCVDYNTDLYGKKEYYVTAVVNAEFYTYSDMAGFALYNITSPGSGTWTLNFDSKVASGVEWVKLYWTQEAPDGTSVKIEASVGGSSWTSETYTDDGSHEHALPLDNGRTLKLVFTLSTDDNKVTPTVSNIKIEFGPVGGGGAAVDKTETMTVGSYSRDFNVYVPSSYAAKASMPLVFSFHGDGMDAAQQADMSQMKQKAEASGFIAVFPNGIGSPQSFNAGACCAQAMNMAPKPDDVAFTEKMIDSLKSEYPKIDDQRIYATGMSNGGFLSYRLACELSNKIAAVAPVAGVMGLSPTIGDFKNCSPTQAVPVLHFHGTDDPIAKYDGTAIWPSVPDTIYGNTANGDLIDGWVKRDGCNLTASPNVVYDVGNAKCKKYNTGCAKNSEVTLCTITNGGHTWPGGNDCPKDIPPFGKCTGDISATDYMWEFFKRCTLLGGCT